MCIQTASTPFVYVIRSSPTMFEACISVASRQVTSCRLDHLLYHPSHPTHSPLNLHPSHIPFLPWTPPSPCQLTPTCQPPPTCLHTPTPWPTTHLLSCIHPNYNVDVSLPAIGAVLAQVRDDREHIIACASCLFSISKQNYSVTKRECLGNFWALQHFQPYIAGARTTVITDHQSLQWLCKSDTCQAQLIRWRGVLEWFNLEITSDSFGSYRAVR